MSFLRSAVLATVIACGAPAKPPATAEATPVHTEPAADAGVADPCLPAFDVRASSKCYIDEFCACADKACGVAVYERYRHMMDTTGAQDTSGFAVYLADAQRMSECSAHWH